MGRLEGVRPRIADRPSAPASFRPNYALPRLRRSGRPGDKAPTPSRWPPSSGPGPWPGHPGALRLSFRRRHRLPRPCREVRPACCGEAGPGSDHLGTRSPVAAWRDSCWGSAPLRSHVRGNFPFGTPAAEVGWGANFADDLQPHKRSLPLGELWDKPSTLHSYSALDHLTWGSGCSLGNSGDLPQDTKGQRAARSGAGPRDPVSAMGSRAASSLGRVSW